MPGRVEWVTDVGRFAALRDAWDRLARGPFERHRWFEAWWEAFSAGRRLAVCVLWQDGELAAALPLLSDRRGLQGLANVHSPDFEPLGSDPAFLDEVLDAAISTDAEELRLTSLPRDGHAFERAAEACRRAGRVVVVEPSALSPVTDTSGSFEAYRQGRRRAWREIERRRRRLAREHRPRISLLRRPTDVEAEVERGFALEASGWKGRKGTAIVSAGDTHGFYGSVARAFHLSGELVTSSIEVDGRLLAFDLGLLVDDRYWLLKTAYAEDWRSLAPGLVLRHHVVEHCFERGLSAHEFLGGNMAWKQLFATGERAHGEILAYRARPVPLLRYGYRRFARPRLAGAYHRIRPPRVGRSGVPR